MQLPKLDSGQNNRHYPLLFLFLKSSLTKATAAVTREESISCSHQPPTWFKQPWFLPQTDGQKEGTGQSPTCGKLHANFLLPLGFSAGKIQISSSNKCFTFSWKWAQSCFEWGEPAGRIHSVTQDILKLAGEKPCVSSDIPYPLPPSCYIAFLRSMLLHLHYFPLHSKSPGSFLRKGFCRYRW